MTVFATELEKKVSLSQSHHDSFLEDKKNTLKQFLLANSLSQKSATFDIEQHSLNNSGFSPKDKVSTVVE